MSSINFFPSYGPLFIKSCYQYFEQSKVDFADKGKREYTETIKDFKILRKISSGTFGDVLLIRNKKTNSFFVAKAIKISKIIGRAKLSIVKKEKFIMERLNHPFIVKLHLFTYDKQFIYFITPYYTGGDLMEHMEKIGRFKENESRFLGAQVVLGLEYLHVLNIIYRDIKPENIVIDHTGYIKIIDFRFAKICKTRTYSACGTVGYMAPEFYTNKGYGKSVDWWAFGILLFEITYGKMPDFVKDPIKLLSTEEKVEFKMPYNFSEELSDLITNLLQVDLTKRFGNLKNGVDDIKDHAWFRPILWMSLLNRQHTPPYSPLLRTNSDLNTDDNISEFELLSVNDVGISSESDLDIS